jgi:hypothetical protein
MSRIDITKLHATDYSPVSNNNITPKMSKGVVWGKWFDSETPFSGSTTTISGIDEKKSKINDQSEISSEISDNVKNSLSQPKTKTTVKAPFFQKSFFPSHGKQSDALFSSDSNITSFLLPSGPVKSSHQLHDIPLPQALLSQPQLSLKKDGSSIHFTQRLPTFVPYSVFIQSLQTSSNTLPVPQTLFPYNLTPAASQIPILLNKSSSTLSPSFSFLPLLQNRYYKSLSYTQLSSYFTSSYSLSPLSCSSNTSTMFSSHLALGGLFRIPRLSLVDSPRFELRFLPPPAVRAFPNTDSLEGTFLRSPYTRHMNDYFYYTRDNHGYSNKDNNLYLMYADQLYRFYWVDPTSTVKFETSSPSLLSPALPTSSSSFQSSSDMLSNSASRKQVGKRLLNEEQFKPSVYLFVHVGEIRNRAAVHDQSSILSFVNM